MIDFGDFYRVIAKGPLSPWLNTLPSQLTAWQKESLHGKFKLWFNSVDRLPLIKPERLDLLHSVTANMETPLNTGGRGLPGTHDQIDCIPQQIINFWFFPAAFATVFTSFFSQRLLCEGHNFFICFHFLSLRTNEIKQTLYFIIADESPLNPPRL